MATVGTINICPKRKENGNLNKQLVEFSWLKFEFVWTFSDILSPLKHELVCELLLNDNFGIPRSGIVAGHHAENFFGNFCHVYVTGRVVFAMCWWNLCFADCTVSQLCSSTEAKARVRTFMDRSSICEGQRKYAEASKIQ